MTGLSSAGVDAPRALARIAARRLVRALQQRRTDALLEAGALVGTTLARCEAAMVGRRALAMVEAVLFALPPGAPPALEGHLEEAIDALAAHPDATHAFVGCVLDALWPTLGGALAPDTPTSAPPPSLATRLQDRLAAHLRGDASLGELADQLGVSLPWASELVRRATGSTFSALRRDVRLEQARTLLRRGASVKEAALGAGFRDPAYFGRVFRRRHGTSPARWAHSERSSR
jgi:AraC-like DNA-binding protein